MLKAKYQPNLIPRFRLCVLCFIHPEQILNFPGSINHDYDRLYMIDFRSDTVTQPTPEMLKAMAAAPVGDDVYGEDPTVNKLQNMLAEMFGYEAGLFCPSGTMANQIAIKCHTRPGDELICHEHSHIYNYEGGGIAFNSGVNVRLTRGPRGIVTPEEVASILHPDMDVHTAPISLIAIENTSNRSGGTTYTLPQLEKISLLARAENLPIHLDGARLFNAMEKEGYTASKMGHLFDSISICLSKGLGAPVGSVLLGNKDFIAEAKYIRKRFGGGMRQSGILAAAGVFALENHINHLATDHLHAQKLATALSESEIFEEVLPVETNIIMARVKKGQTAQDWISRFYENGIRIGKMDALHVRFVTHFQISKSDISKTEQCIKSF